MLQTFQYIYVISSPAPSHGCGESSLWNTEKGNSASIALFNSVFKRTALWSYNLHAMQFTHLK